jgi:hypothetical protein
VRGGEVVATVAIALALASAAAAHHSVAAQFNMSRTTTLVGTVVKVGWINPHPYVMFDVKEKSGTVQWTLSTQPLAVLLDAGITKGQLAGTPGETVTAVVHPALNGKPAAWVRRLVYSDGRSFSLFEP